MQGTGCVALAVLLLAAGSTLPVQAAPEVDTEYGRVRGVEEYLPEVSAFYKIPFAAPPVNSLRLRPPMPPTPWNDTKDCNKDDYEHICPQLHPTKKTLLGQEDCLYLNVYVPGKVSPGKNLPVMFWIYGGGFVIGDDDEFGLYKAKNLAAKRNVIMVETNYRLAELGFLALPGLAAESDGTTGNYGVQDQQAALAFTFRNIAKFGGDPSKIIIFGESAGAFSVCWHLVSEVSRPYFSAAIMESGTCESPEFFVSEQRAYNFSMEVVNHLKCENPSQTEMVACIRSKAVTDMFMSFKNSWPSVDTRPPLAPIMPYGPAIDKSPKGLLDRPIELINAGRFARVPVILGTNLNEGTVFVDAIDIVVPGTGLPINATGVTIMLQHLYNDTATAVINNYYPADSFKAQSDRVAVILRDYMFTCSNRRTARALSKYVDVHLYQFVAKLPTWPDYDLYGDYHTLELPFVFDHQWPVGVHIFTPEMHKLSDTFTLYWSNLARFGSPNGDLGKDDIAWPTYNATTDQNIFLKHPAEVGAHLNNDACNMWDTIYSKYYFSG
jgi:para-nitrobenzyl esterase